MTTLCWNLHLERKAQLQLFAMSHFLKHAHPLPVQTSLHLFLFFSASLRLLSVFPLLEIWTIHNAIITIVAVVQHLHRCYSLFGIVSILLSSVVDFSTYLMSHLIVIHFVSFQEFFQTECFGIFCCWNFPLFSWGSVFFQPQFLKQKKKKRKKLLQVHEGFD